MCGPQIRLCLFMFLPIASKQLISLTTITTLIWLGGAEVTYPSALGFYVWFLLLLLFYFFVQKHIICHKILQFLLQC